jgi:hypothetical protein
MRAFDNQEETTRTMATYGPTICEYVGMYLEAVITCVDYDDYLALTLPHNKREFDRVIVVTTPRDEATRALCRSEGVETVLTDAFFEGGHRFHKGHGVNAGLDALQCRDWALITDADMILPPGLKSLLKDLDPECIYGAGDKPGADLIPGAAAGAPWPTQTFFEDIPSEQSQKRLFFYIPVSQLGSFQLYSAKLHPKRRYPVEYSHSTGLFPLQWEPSQRRWLGHFASIHLGTEGRNWKGRVTPRLGAEPQSGDR